MLDMRLDTTRLSIIAPSCICITTHRATHTFSKAAWRKPRYTEKMRRPHDKPDAMMFGMASGGRGHGRSALKVMMHRVPLMRSMSDL